MTLPVRIQIVRPDPRILSWYKGKDGNRRPLNKLRGGWVTPDHGAALLQLHLDVARDGGVLLITDCYRDAAMQGAARAKYERWLAAGKPKIGSSDYDPKTMKNAYVARPGRSFHGGARADDFAHMEIPPADVPKNRKLDWLWARAIPLGFEPIIKTPDEGAKESWHMDFRGCWDHVYDNLGYEQGAMCAVLDIGQGAEIFARPWERWVQAQMWRVGIDLGDVDGHWGKRTTLAAALLGLDLEADKTALNTALMALPDAGRVTHVTG